MYAEAVHSLMTIIARGNSFMGHGYARTDITRNEMAATLLRQTFTHILMLDSDHIHPPDIVAKLAQWPARDRDKFMVVGGLNFRRGVPYDPCAYMWNDGKLAPIHRWPDDALLKVDVLGSGSILIDRRVFERLPYPWFGYDYSLLDALGWPECGVEGLRAATWPGTDVWFSKLCNKAHIDQWVYSGVSSPHIMHTTITQAVREAFLRAAEAHGEIITVTKPTRAHIPENGGDKCQSDDGERSEHDGARVPLAGALPFAESLPET